MSRSIQQFIRLRYGVAALAGLLLILSAATVQAQMGALPIDGKTQARLQARMQEMQLFQSGALKKELSLTEDQVFEINLLIDQMRQDMMGIFQDIQNTNPEDMERTMVTIVNRMDSKVTQLHGRVELQLDDKQKARLKQISLQIRGVMGLDDPEVMEAIGLTYEQKQKLEGIREDVMKKQQKVAQEMMAGGAPDQNAMRTLMTDIQSETETRFIEVLTRPQVDAFAKLKGPLFKR